MVFIDKIIVDEAPEEIWCNEFREAFFGKFYPGCGTGITGSESESGDKEKERDCEAGCLI